MKTKTNYAGHDTAYKRRRAEGKVGWDETPQAYAEREAGLIKLLGQGYAPCSGMFLELGCGAGNISIWFAQHGFEVTGVDISETAILWARERAQSAGVKAQFMLGNVLELNGVLSDASIDFVLDGHCLHCIIGEDRKTFLQTAWRFAKSGGFFLVDTMCGPVESGSVDGYDPASCCTMIQGLPTRYFGSPDQIQKEICDAGFDVLDVSIERNKSHGNMMIQARMRPT